MLSPWLGTPHSGSLSCARRSWQHARLLLCGLSLHDEEGNKDQRGHLNRELRF